MIHASKIRARFEIVLASILFCLPALGQQSKPSSPSLPGHAWMTGSLRVKTDVTGAQVFLDEEAVGQTPLTLTSVAAGKHVLALVKEGYNRHEQEVEVIPSKMASVFVVMMPYATPLPQLPVKYSAIHKHVSGYCKGVLTVNADGLDYKSDDGSDVFHMPISQMRFVSRSTGSGVLFVIPTNRSVTYVGAGNQAATEQIDSMQRNIKSKAGVETLKSLVPLRIDMPNRGYGFWAYEEGPAEANDANRRSAEENPEMLTRELFDLVFRLWTADLTVRSKAKEKH